MTRRAWSSRATKAPKILSPYHAAVLASATPPNPIGFTASAGTCRTAACHRTSPVLLLVARARVLAMKGLLRRHRASGRAEMSICSRDVIGLRLHATGEAPARLVPE